MLTRRSRLLALAALLPLCLLARPALAAWPVDPGVNVPLATGSSFQYGPAAVADGAGGMLVGFVDGSDIRTLRVNPDGSIRWNVLVCGATGTQQSVVVTSDGAGGAILAWSDNRSGNFDIYAQRVNALGAVQWAANGVALCTVATDQTLPVIASNGASGAVVAWQDLRNSAFFDIYAQVVTSSGAIGPVGGVAVCTAAGDQRELAMTATGVGGVVLAWRDGRADGGDIYAQLLATGGTLISNYWAANGVAAAAQANTQSTPTVTTDGQFGALVFWTDGRAGTGADLYGQRIDINGIARWPFGGYAVANGTGSETLPSAVSDGAGGAFVSFSDTRNAGLNGDIYAQHVSPAGGGMWGATGTSVNTNAAYADYSRVISDGAGGVVVSWIDIRFDALGGDYFAQRLNAAGSRLWTSDGVAVTTAYSNGYVIAPAEMVLTPEGDALFAWNDSRDVFGGNGDIYGQRVDHFGVLGDPAPVMVSVRDVKNDQGGQVKVSWTASYLEYEPYLTVSEYRLYRSAPAAAALAAEQAAGAAAGDRIVGELHADGTLAYWEQVAIVPAQRSEDYGLVAATTSDSVTGSNPRTLFRVQARNSSGTQWWYSANDSGYSVDNLAPFAPGPVAGTYAGGSAHLRWNPNTEPDLLGYRVYRGTVASFTPGPGNLVGAPPDTGFVDVAGLPAFYKVTAVDVHGNESLASLVLPSGALGVDGSPPATLSFARPEPNPARGATTLRYALPAEAHVVLSIYDASGRRVRLLASGVSAAGEHAAAWDLRDDGGNAVGAGLYFARLEAGGRTFTRRVIALR
jgi:hypothetical protein